MKTTTINDALVAAVGRSHANLLDDLATLDAAARSPHTEVVELRARLVAAQIHVAAHFRFEEQNGYLDTVRECEPRLGHTIDALAAEHPRLTASLSAIV